MSLPKQTSDETPVDDVRRVREKLSEACGNDVNRLADHAREITENLPKELGLKRAKRSDRNARD